MAVVSLVGLLSGQADAQYFRRCSEPYEPALPSGHYEDHYWQMESAKAEIERYLLDVESYQDCLAKNYKEASESAERVLSEWESAVRAYNSR